MSREKVVPIKPETVYADKPTEKVRLFLQDLLHTYGLSINQFSTLVEVGRSTLTEFLSGSYPYPEKLAKEIRPELEGAAKRLAEKSAEAGVPIAEGDIFETRAYKRARQVLDACREQGKIGVITGHAGVGKTVAVGSYAAARSDTALITADPTFGKIGCLKALARFLGLDPSQHSMFVLENVVMHLPTVYQLVIVDEADQLTYPGLEILRSIHDRCGNRVGLVLSGMPKLWHNMTTGRKGGQDLAQLYSRVAIFSDLPMPSRKEVQAFIKANYKGKVPKEVTDILYQEAAVHGMRRLAMLLPGAVEIAKKNNEELSAEAVEVARDAYMMMA